MHETTLSHFEPYELVHANCSCSLTCTRVYVDHMVVLLQLILAKTAQLRVLKPLCTLPHQTLTLFRFRIIQVCCLSFCPGCAASA